MVCIQIFFLMTNSWILKLIRKTKSIVSLFVYENGLFLKPIISDWWMEENIDILQKIVE